MTGVGNKSGWDLNTIFGTPDFGLMEDMRAYLKDMVGEVVSKMNS